MKTLLKILAVLVGIVVLVIIVASIALPLFFDPNDFKGEITRLVKERTGRELTIGGDISLSVFPWLGVKVEQVQLSNAAGFGPEPMARVADAGVRVKLMPLLHKQIEMDTLVLKGLELNLERGPKGSTNWEDLTAPSETTPETPQQGGGGSPLGALAIGGIDVENSKVVWNDQQAKSHYAVNDLDLQVGEIVPAQPIDIDLSFDLQSQEPALDTGVKLTGRVLADPAAKTYRIENLKLVADVRKGPAGLAGTQAQLAADVAADLAKQTLALDNLKLSALGVTATGALQGTQIVDAPAFKGTLNVPAFEPRKVLDRLGSTLQTADPKALQSASLALQLQATPSSAQLDNVKLQLDDTTVTGKMKAAPFSPLAATFDLNVDRIDLDRYLPPPAAPEQNGQAAASAPAAAAVSPAGAAAAGASALPLDALRSLNLNGTLRIGEMKAYNLHTSGLSLTVSARNGALRVHPATAKLYQGTYNGDVQLDVRQAKPKIALDEKLQGVQVGPLLKDLQGIDRLTGTADMNAKLTGTGTDVDAIRPTLNGNLGFAFRDGAVKGVNIARLIREAQAALKGQPLAADTGPNQTDFTELTGTATVTNGVLRNDDLVAKSPLLRVNGSGSVDLVRQQIDYLVKAAVVGTIAGQGGASLGELKNVTVPIRVTGTFSKPKYAVDIKSAISESAKAKVEQKIEQKKEEVQQKIENKIQDKLQNKLKGLFR